MIWELLTGDYFCLFGILGWVLFVVLIYGIIFVVGRIIIWFTDLIPTSRKVNINNDQISESYGSDSGESNDSGSTWDGYNNEVDSRAQREADHIKYGGPVDTRHMSEGNKRWVEHQRDLGYDDEDINRRLDH